MYADGRWSPFFKHWWGEALFVIPATTALSFALMYDKPAEVKNTPQQTFEKEIKALDSLKKDSIAQKAYFEGAQMVRDSIANLKKQK